MSRFQKGMSIDEVNEEARKLGLSYGQYVAYRDTGYLKHYEKMLNASKIEVGNKYVSCIGAGRSIPKNTMEHRYSH